MNNRLIQTPQQVERFSDWYRQSYAIAYCGLVSASVLLPSAKVAGFNVKISLAIFLIAIGIVVWPRTLLESYEASRFTKRYLAIFAYLAVVLAYWSVVALQNGFSPAGELRSMLGPLVVVAGYHPRLVPKRWLLRSYCMSAIAYSSAKLVLVAAVHLGVGQEFDLITIGRDVFEIELVGGPTCGPSLHRLALVNDLAIAMFPLVLLEAHYRRLMVYAAVVVCGLAVFASYSRYLLLAFIAICLITAWKVPHLRARLAVCLVSTFAIAFAVGAGGCLASRLLSVSGMDQENGGGSLNRYTDSIRKEQLHRLGRLIQEKPIHGYGIGSYDRDYVRSSQMPYSYELQLLSLIAKFGVVGFALIACGFLALCGMHFGGNLAAWTAVVTLSASGLTNPFYESTAFGVAFLIISATFSAVPTGKLQGDRQ